MKMPDKVEKVNFCQIGPPPTANANIHNSSAQPPCRLAADKREMASMAAALLVKLNIYGRFPAL